jgi:hypothetical protein
MLPPMPALLMYMADDEGDSDDARTLRPLRAPS